MAELTIGDCRISGDRNRLEIRHQTSARPIVEFDSVDIARLDEFLAGLLQESDDASRRQSFRVQVMAPDDLTATIHIDGQSVSTRSLDISMTGILVELPKGHPLGQDVGQDVELTIRCGRQSIRLAARISRRPGDKCGLLFSDSIRNEESQPPEELAQLVMQAQRRRILKTLPGQ